MVRGLALTVPLLCLLRRQYALDWTGVHGVRHWARVRLYGLQLATETGADPRVIEYFAFLHDAWRISDHDDDDHGHRAAAFVATLPRGLVNLPPPAFRQLLIAIDGHADQQHADDATVATCWDADRLDLGRLSVRPNPARLLTAPAKRADFLDYCWRRSRTRHPIPTSGSD